MDVVKEYCNVSQFHGFRYLAEPGRHWMERLFWLICVIGSWYLCLDLIHSSLVDYTTNSLSFGTDTSYLSWNTSLFSVSVCEQKNKDGVYRKGRELWGEFHDYNLDEILMEMAYFRGDHYFIKTFCAPGRIQLKCPSTVDELVELSESVKKKCFDVFKSCIWNGVRFRCCDYFHPLKTERGLCYTLNSLQTENQTKFPTISNRFLGKGNLTVEIVVPADVFVHSPANVPTLSPEVIEIVQNQRYLKKRRVYTITNIINDGDVRGVPVEQRQCRFPDENYLPYYKSYSYSACTVNCRIQKQMQLCNCTSHLNPIKDRSLLCNMTGLLCLIENYSRYTKVVPAWSNKDGLSCGCSANCDEPELDLIEEENKGIQREYGIIEFTLASLPTLRLRRRVVRGTLDLVVSMGGSVGLFVGASLLSFVELFYFCFVRLCWERLCKRRQLKALERNLAQSKEKNISSKSWYPSLRIGDSGGGTRHLPLPSQPIAPLQAKLQFGL